MGRWTLGGVLGGPHKPDSWGSGCAKGNWCAPPSNEENEQSKAKRPKRVLLAWGWGGVCVGSGTRSWRGPRLPSRPSLQGLGWVGEKPLPSGSPGPESRWGPPRSPRGALGEPSPGPDFSPSPPAWAPLPPRPRIEAPRPGFDLSANRLARKLSASLVSPAAGSVVCGRARSGGDAGAATRGRPSTWVPARGSAPGVRLRGGGRGAGPPTAAPAPFSRSPEASSSIIQEMTQ